MVSICICTSAKYGFELYSLLVFMSGIKWAGAILQNAWEIGQKFRFFFKYTNQRIDF
jgi:hypothetical protein